MRPSYLDENFCDFIEPSFRHASALLGRRGVDVRNLSMESALGEDIFPKLRWQTLVQGAACAGKAARACAPDSSLDSLLEAVPGFAAASTLASARAPTSTLA